MMFEKLSSNVAGQNMCWSQTMAWSVFSVLYGTPCDLSTGTGTFVYGEARC